MPGPFPAPPIFWGKSRGDEVELYSPTQSMSFYSRFSRSIRSLSFAPFFFFLRIFIWARCSTYSATSFSGTIYLSEYSVMTSLSPLTNIISSKQSLNLRSRLEVAWLTVIGVGLGSLRYGDYGLRLRTNMLLRMIKTRWLFIFPA